MKWIKIFLVLVVTALAVPEAFARPEYALQIRTNRCTTCHANPTGGGHRNLTGKAFGPKAVPLGAFSQQDIFGFDFRTVFYTPVKKEDIKKGKSGLGVMAALPSISVPFNKSNGKEWRLVYSHNVGGFLSAGARDAYLRVQLYEDYRLYPQYILIGRFPAPFGLLDDEHRTYIRQQTKTSWNDQEIGVLLSGDWSYRLHYDLAVVNGEQTAGASFGTGNSRSLQWGGIANLRLLFMDFGWMLGASASYYNNEKNAHAFSVYQNLSLDGLTKNLLPGNLSGEAVLARKMNSRLRGNKFVSQEAEYLEKFIDKDSLGFKVQWNYNFLPAWRFIFKYDQLGLDRWSMKYSYWRYGVGLRYFFNNQVSAQLRYEKAITGHESEKSLPEGKAKGLAAMDVVWALLQVKI